MYRDVSMHASSTGNSVAPGPVEVTSGALRDSQRAVFSSAFRIGRATECEVCIQNDYVSRTHAKVTPETSGWQVTDLNSSNGIYWRGSKVESVLVTSSEVVRLGIDGPELSLHVQEGPKPGDSPLRTNNVDQSVSRYFRGPVDVEVVGEHTRYTRNAFAKIQTQQRQVQARQ